MNPNKNQNELKNFFEFLTEDDCKDIKQVKEELISAGIQPDELLKEGNEIVKKLIGKKRKELTKVRLLQIKEKLNSFLQTNNKISGTTAKEFLLNLLGDRNSDTLQTSFRKIENLSDKEALEILNENQLLEFFSKIMNEEK